MRRDFTQSSETLDPGQPGGHGTGTALVIRTREQTRKPPMYKVLILNDDFTPVEYVVGMLGSIFNMEYTEAVRVMRAVHEKGVGLAGIFTFEIAETKSAQVDEDARRHEHPLKSKIERMDNGPA